MHPTRSSAKSLVLPLFLLAFLCLPLSGQRQAAAAKPAPALDKAALEQYLRHLYVWGPQIKIAIGNPGPSDVPGLWEVQVNASAGAASFQQRLLLSSDGKRIIQGTVYDLSDNPFRLELSKLTTDSAPSIGTPGAPVVLVLFTDFECPYCRDEAKTLKQNLLTKYPKEVRLYLKDYPLVSIHPWARQAAIAGRCIFRQNADAFWLYHDWVFGQQDQINAQNLQSKVTDFVKTQQIDGLLFGRCLQEKETDAEVSKSVAEGLSLQVNSTPTLFVNGRHLPSQVTWDQLAAIIDYEIQYQKTAKNAGDKPCCEVTLPSPVPQR